MSSHPEINLANLFVFAPKVLQYPPTPSIIHTMSRPFKLYRLQQIDSQIDKLEARIKEIDTILSDQREVEEAKKVWEEAAQKLTIAQKELRQAEELVENQKLKIEQSESSLYGGHIRNPKELEDLHNEVSSLKKYLTVLEDRLLEKMVAEEEVREIEANAQEILNDLKKKKEQLASKLLDEKEELDSQISRFKTERQAAVSSMTKEDMVIYEKLRASRHGIAVAKVLDNTCSACGSTLNTALLHKAHSPNEISYCSSCNRILYVG